MQKEVISIRQAICIISVFLIGSSLIMGANSEAGQDSWIAFIFAAITAVPVLLIYARIMKLLPGMDIYDVSLELFGKIGGKIVIALLTWYAIHLGAMVLRNFSEFIELVALPETPQVPIMFAMVFVAIYIAKSGVVILGRWAIIIYAIISSVVLITLIFSIANMDITNILPVMSHSFKEVAGGSYKILVFPFAETILFLALPSSIKKEESPYKTLFFGLIFGALVLFIAMLRNILCLGSTLLQALYFSSFTTARLINIGSFLSRIEGSVSLNFILAGITKITVCLLAASNGFAKLFDVQNYKKIVFPVGMLVVALCAILFENIIEMFSFIQVYQFYAIPFQFIIPILIWVAAEIKTRMKSKNKQETTMEN